MYKLICSSILFNGHTAIRFQTAAENELLLNFIKKTMTNICNFLLPEQNKSCISSFISSPPLPSLPGIAIRGLGEVWAMQSMMV